MDRSGDEKHSRLSTIVFLLSINSYVYDEIPRSGDNYVWVRLWVCEYVIECVRECVSA